MTISRFERPLSLIPFGYLVVSRGRNPWELLYMVGNSWLPAIWLIVRLGGMDLLPATLSFLVGYVAFISCYEIGYLTNDTWDASRFEDGRRRIGFRVSPAYVASFIAIRVLAWVAIGYLTGWMADEIWLAAYGALFAVFALHNILKSPIIRIASFFQLSVLRFTLPILGAIVAANYLIAVIVGFLFYTLFRLISYLDSKDLLRTSEPRTGRLKLALLAAEAPIAILLSLLARSSVPMELFAYYLALYALISVHERRSRQLDTDRKEFTATIRSH